MIPYDYSILYWIAANKIKNEKGDELEFRKHLYLADIYADQSQYLCVTKAAQIGMSTLEVLKNFWDANRAKMDIIYILPTDSDVQTFVGGKVNRLIANNSILSSFTKDKDTVEQKQVHDSMVYFRGSWTKKSAIMITADRLSMDEKDSCKQDILADYEARLQHSRHRQIHTFSHPSLPDFGISRDWDRSDKKHWFIKCSRCKEKQYLSWSLENEDEMSVDLEREFFRCKKCKKELSDDDRRRGEWGATGTGEFSGYWISLLMAPWVSAYEIIKKYKDNPGEFFYNKVLGLPYLDSQAKLLEHQFFSNLTHSAWLPDKEDRIIIGIDTGLRLDFVAGNDKGLFLEGDSDDYGTLNEMMERWERAVAIIDQGGDIIAARKFYEMWPGRVFLCSLGGEKKGKELVKWGEGIEFGFVSADRDRCLQILVGEFKEKRIPLHGSEDDWYGLWLDFRNLSRMKITDPVTGMLRGYKWVRSGRDHKALACLFYRIGMSRFGWNMTDSPAAKRFVFPMPLKTAAVVEDGYERLLTPEGEDMVEATMRMLRRGRR